MASPATTLAWLVDDLESQSPCSLPPLTLFVALSHSLPHVLLKKLDEEVAGAQLEQFDVK